MLTKNIEQMKIEVRQHIDADAVVQGKYWENGKGCFIGCLAHSSNAKTVTERFGMSLPLVKIAEHIFERLDKADAVQFFNDIPNAIGVDGKDLSLTHWKFLEHVLRDLPPVGDKIQAVIDPVIEGMRLLGSGSAWDAAVYAAYAAARAAAAAARAAADAADAAKAAAYTAYADAAAAAAYAAAYADADANAANAANAASVADVVYAVADAVYADAVADAAEAADVAVYAAEAADAAVNAAIIRQRDLFLKLIREA